MKKSNTIIIVVIAVLVIAGGAFALFHKSSNNGSSKSTTSTNAPAVNNAVLTTKTDPTIGQYLTDPDGNALYTYGGDTSDASNCTGSCLSAWPAYEDTGATTGLPAGVGTITRSDNGKKQFTYNGMPLYTFASDSAGHVTGNGVSNFTIAKPAASTSGGSSSSSGSSSNSSNYPY